MSGAALRVRVAGSSSAVPRPGSACSCYLIETAGTKIILDCGTGALQSLQRFIDPLSLNAVVISHFHADHTFDLVALRYLFAFAPAQQRRRLDVYVPPDSSMRMERLAAAAQSSEGEQFFERSMRVREYESRRSLEIADLQIRFAPAQHYIEAYAMRVSDGRASIAYSADTAPCSPVAGLARDADLFICESTLGTEGVDREPRGHCNAREAGRMAREAAARHLLLTHYGAWVPAAELKAAAAREFSGTISVAEDGWSDAV